MNALNRFNWLAGNYDQLGRVVFGRDLHLAQKAFIDEIQKNARILILGGGSGLFLQDVLRINPSSKVWYIEASSSMIEMAKSKIPSPLHQQIQFIHGTEDSIPEGIKFDVVITNFFLDLFPASTLSSVLKKIQAATASGCKWMVCDFINTGKIWHRILLKVMYTFFRLTCGISARRLPPWEKEFEKIDFVEARFVTRFGGFIKSAVYVKANG